MTRRPTRRRSTPSCAQLDVGAAPARAPAAAAGRSPTASRASTRAARWTRAGGRRARDGRSAIAPAHARGAVPAGTLRGAAARPRRGARRSIAEALAGIRGGAATSGAVAKTLRAHQLRPRHARRFFAGARLPVARARDRRAHRQRPRAARRRCARSASCIRERATTPPDSTSTGRASRCARSRADAIERGKTLNNIGINLKNLGQLDEALAALDRGAAAVRRRSALPLQPVRRRSTTSGWCTRRWATPAAAERTLREALDAVGRRPAID